MMATYKAKTSKPQLRKAKPYTLKYTRLLDCKQGAKERREEVKERSVSYPAFVEYHPETGKYGGFALDLPIHVAGKASFEEAKEALEEGARVYLAYLEAEGKPAPEPGSCPPLDLDDEIKAWLTPVLISV